MFSGIYLKIKDVITVHQIYKNEMVEMNKWWWWWWCGVGGGGGGGEGGGGGVGILPQHTNLTETLSFAGACS